MKNFTPALCFSLALQSLCLLPLAGCITEDQEPAQETVIIKTEDSDSSLPPEAIADLGSENVTNPVIPDKKGPALTPDDIEADADPMKIGFETANWQLSDVARSRIRDVAETLKSDPSKHLRIDGHCDERGSDGYNQALSVKRAETVRRELVRLGINKKRLKATGFGRRRTLVKGHSEKVYSHNRRVEMIFAN